MNYVCCSPNPHFSSVPNAHTIWIQSAPKDKPNINQSFGQVSELRLRDNQERLGSIGLLGYLVCYLYCKDEQLQLTNWWRIDVFVIVMSNQL